MLKKTITYTDFNGEKRTEDLYFNLTKAELVEMELGIEGGFKEYCAKIAESKNVAEVMYFFKDIILNSYGVKSADGKYFIKFDENGRRLADKFVQSEAYSELFIQMAQEGAIQVFEQKGVGLESYIVGVVGVLQLEVLEYRLNNEYSAQLLMNQLPYSVARWVYAEDKKLIENIKGLDNGMLVYDTKERPVILVNNEWSLNWILDRNPGIQFLTVPADVEKI